MSTVKNIAKQIQDDVYERLVDSGLSKQDAWAGAYASEYEVDDLIFDGEDQAPVPELSEDF